jgi:hypothetical protein
MNLKRLFLGVGILGYLTAAISTWAQTPDQKSEPPSSASSTQSAPSLSPIDLPALIREWEKHRDEARERWLANQRAYTGGPGFLGPAINRDRGLQEAAEWMISDLKKLQQSAKTEAERQAGLTQLREGWLKGRESAHERWVQNRQMMPQKTPQKDAAAEFWEAILNTNRGPVAPVGGRLAAAINNDAGMMEAFDWMFSDLEKHLGKLPTAPAQKSAAQAVIERLPKGIITSTQLDAFLEENKDLGLSTEVMQEVKELFRKNRLEQVVRLQALARSVRDTPVPLASTPPSPVPFAPSMKDASLVVTADEEEVRAKLGLMRELVRRLTGVGPDLKLWYVWKGPDGKELGSEPTYESRVVVPIKEPKPITVSVVRHVRLDAEVPDDDSLVFGINAVVDQVHSAQGSLGIEIKPLEFPAEIAGRWTGSLTVTELPILTHWKDEPAPARRGDADEPLQALAEGCSIPAEAFAQLRKELEKLKGQPLRMTLDLAPQDASAGRATLAVTPPRGAQAADKPQELRYRYEGGSLTIESAHAKLALVLKGNLAPAAQGWQVSGTWQAYAGGGAKQVLAMHGVWTATNPNVK